MYFDLKPKAKKEDLFGSEFILQKFKKSLNNKNTRLIVVKGLRRTGKTSLLNVALKESKLDFLKIDARSTPFFDYLQFITEFKNYLNSILNKNIIKKIKNKIDSVHLSLGYKDVNTKVKFDINKDKTINKYLEEINKIYSKKNKQLIIAIDEVQLLKNIKIDYLFSSIYDNYEYIKLVFTGSEIGLLSEFLGEKDYDAPLYGRLFETIETKRLREQESYTFLKEGLKQINIKHTEEELMSIVNQFDGIIGWHTQYGSERMNNNNHYKSIEKTKTYGKELNKREFNKFLNTRKNKVNYLNIMRSIKKGENTWAEIKHLFSKMDIKINDSQLYLYLNTLVKYGFIEEINKKYLFTDPLLVLSF